MIPTVGAVCDRPSFASGRCGRGEIQLSPIQTARARPGRSTQTSASDISTGLIMNFDLVVRQPATGRALRAKFHFCWTTDHQRGSEIPHCETRLVLAGVVVIMSH